ncbi:MAG: DEAD/DEAH box helicase [Phycisphaeraceae bacterium]
MSLLTTWSPFFQSSVRMRGRGYQASNRVQRLEPEDDELVRAQVQGREAYLVTIREEQTRALAECTCPSFAAGSYCKHIWATLLDVQQNPQAPGASAAELTGLRVRSPKARRREGDAGAVSRRSSEPEWMGRLTLLRPASEDLERQAGTLLPTQRQVCYVILPEASRQQHGLVVELRQRTPVASGWSKSKAMRVSPSTVGELADPADRELCALLIGGAQADDEPVGVMGGPIGGRVARGHAAYRIAPGAWRTLARRMVATGRCYIEAGEDRDEMDERPLRWSGDEPWVLWMVGELVEESLEVRLELRRGQERTPVEQSRLLLGGGDGVVIDDEAVSPFDDREAFRWASQFRDDARRHEGARPIVVARGDIERFLDRLYMLPQLPEIDLPEGVGRTPRHVAPVPHLELYSPESSEAQQALPGSSKTQLLARVRFAYEQQTVSPAQPGPFVAISSAASRGEASEGGAAVAVGAAHAEDGGEGDAPDAERSFAHGGEAADLGEDASQGGRGDGDEQGEATKTGEEAGDAEAAGAGVLIRRDRHAEREAMATLAELGFRPVASAGADTLTIAPRQMGAAVSALLAQGWHLAADQQAIRQAGAPRLSVRSGIDWFELRGGVRYERGDGEIQEVPLPQILAAARAGHAMIQLDDGSQGLLPEQWLADHGMLAAIGKQVDDHLRFTASQAAVLDAMLDARELEDVDEAFARVRRRLSEFDGVQALDPAPAFRGSLRPYQREGLGWLAFLRWFGFGGILADDMGLGKTIQVLAMLEARAKRLPGHWEGDAEEAPSPGPSLERSGAQGGAGPSLVVAPRSLVFNWVDEAERFTPDLRVQAYHGSERQELRAAFDEHDVIVTSYGLLRRDIEELAEHTFDYVVLDEAQAIKNPASQAAKAARLLNARHRVALTGTPVENHLGDLWSIFEFLNPGMLGSSSRFAEMVRGGTELNAAAAAGEAQPAGATSGATSGGANGGGSGGGGAIGQVARMLRPFILRRTKRQVLADLPAKTEQTIVCEMEPGQQRVYDELRAYYRQHLMTQLGEIGHGAGENGGASGGGPVVGGRAGFMVLEALLRLRQAACHPGLIDPDRYGDDPSGKLEVLLELLGDVLEEGSKALIFSQFTSMLGLVRRRLDERGIRYAYLDGQTNNRREVVASFQEDKDIGVFLVSLKTGGFGLNLTAAEYVFILDPWWNPAVEQQAIDRTHRIGQTRHVFAYRLICQDTVEQRITQLQAQKRQIADAIVGGEEQQVLRQLTRDDLERLLS